MDAIKQKRGVSALSQQAAVPQPVAELMSVEELALGIKYTDPIKTSWRPPRYVCARPEAKNELIRQRWNILVEGVVSTSLSSRCFNVVQATTYRRPSSTLRRCGCTQPSWPG